MDAKTFQAAASCPSTFAAQWAKPISDAMAEFGIATTTQQADFIAQWAHETAGFLLMREVWGPTATQLRYEGRADLGNTQKGDGFLYRGRGFPMLTGRRNYAAASAALGVDLVKSPQLLEQPELAARVGGWFWRSNSLNRYSDRNDFLGLSIRINGKNKDGLPNGWEDRQRRRTIARRALGVQ